MAFGDRMTPPKTPDVLDVDAKFDSLWRTIRNQHYQLLALRAELQERQQEVRGLREEVASLRESKRVMTGVKALKTGRLDVMA